MRNVQKRNGLKQITVHGLRHTHCSILFSMGASIKDVQARLGHTNIQTTMHICAHVTREEKKTLQINLLDLWKIKEVC